MANFECPVCREGTRVSRTTMIDGTSAKRERVCFSKPPHTFVTIETTAQPELLVVRASGQVAPFDREKLERSIRQAAASTIPRDPQITKIADEALRILAPQPRVPIPTADLGDAVLLVLKRTTPVAAVRYATTFLAKRGRIDGPEDLATWLKTEILPKAQPALMDPSRPVFVIKSRRSNEPVGQGEDFSLIKLWDGLSRATRGLGLNGKAYDAAGYDDAVGSVAAWILDQLRAQPIVTTGQISAETLRVLRSVCPLGSLRYSILVKSYTTASAVLDECQSLTEYPPAPIDLTQYEEAGAALAEEVRAWKAR
ncbi:ATP cone domain-containing protein [Kribbella sp. NPDC003557]|uniref:ATP cone domain-containing protein n=1 Tax=Kribbella sp. NPDC003557 TaxID=3154449 RepID=UPI0033A8970C